MALATWELGQKQSAIELANAARVRLASEPEARVSLCWIAINDGSRVIRVRALTLLRFYPSEATRTLLIEVSQNTSQSSAVRAAALRGMAGFDFSNDVLIRDELQSRLRDSNSMLSVAAVQTLAKQESTIGIIRKATNDMSLTQVTRDAAIAATN